MLNLDKLAIQIFKRKLLSFSKIAGLTICLCIASDVIATSADRDQPMQIEAGKVIMKENKGISRYTGNVKITQGSRLILGDNITIYSDKGEVSKVIIKGQPASFSQLNDKDEKIHASSNEMTFYSKTDILVLKENAVLQQKDNVFRSEKISYNTAKDIITAGKQNGTADERVKITIHPKKESTEENNEDNDKVNDSAQ